MRVSYVGKGPTKYRICGGRYLTQLYLQWPTNRKVVYDLPNGAIFNDLERPLPTVSRSRHSLTLNISETVRHTDIVSLEY